MNKEKYIGFRVKADQRARIEALAKGSEMNFSEYVLRCALLGYVFTIRAELPREINVAGVEVERVSGGEGQVKKRNVAG